MKIYNCFRNLFKLNFPKCISCGKKMRIVDRVQAGYEGFSSRFCCQINTELSGYFIGSRFHIYGYIISNYEPGHWAGWTLSSGNGYAMRSYYIECDVRPQSNPRYNNYKIDYKTDKEIKYPQNIEELNSTINRIKKWEKFK